MKNTQNKSHNETCWTIIFTLSSRFSTSFFFHECVEHTTQYFYAFILGQSVCLLYLRFVKVHESNNWILSAETWQRRSKNLLKLPQRENISILFVFFRWGFNLVRHIFLASSIKARSKQRIDNMRSSVTITLFWNVIPMKLHKRV